MKNKKENNAEWILSVEWVEPKDDKYQEIQNLITNGAGSKESFKTLKPLYIEIAKCLDGRFEPIKSLDLMKEEQRVSFIVMLNNLLHHKFKFELI